jgi:hypothetical protein
MKISALNFDDQTLIVHSALLGNKARDTDSFTQRLVRC